MLASSVHASGLPARRQTLTHKSAAPRPRPAAVRRVHTAPHAHRPRHRLRAVDAAEAADAPPSTAPRLADLEMKPVLDQQGFVRPTIPDGAAAAVFAIYSDARVLQLVAFSTDLRRSLLTVLGRRPDKAFYYKVHFFPDLDQAAMSAARDAWFAEVGGQPPGNKLALERAAWTQPVSAGAISERGQRAAAEGKAAEMEAALRARGCAEALVPDERLLAEGQVEFVPAAQLTEEQVAAAAAAAEAAAAGARTIPLPGLDPDSAAVRTLGKFAANGGTIFDVALAYDALETHHRIIVGSGWHATQGAPPEAALDATLSFLIRASADMRRTEGVLDTDQFNANYFSLLEVDQQFKGFGEYLATHGLGPGAPAAPGVSEEDAKKARAGTRPWSFARWGGYGDGGVADPRWGEDGTEGFV